MFKEIDHPSIFGGGGEYDYTAPPAYNDSPPSYNTAVKASTQNKFDQLEHEYLKTIQKLTNQNDALLQNPPVKKEYLFYTPPTKYVYPYTFSDLYDYIFPAYSDSIYPLFLKKTIEDEIRRDIAYSKPKEYIRDRVRDIIDKYTQVEPAKEKKPDTKPDTKPSKKPKRKSKKRKKSKSRGIKK